jgi:hypothetical protein
MKAKWIFVILTFILVNCTNQQAEEGSFSKDVQSEMSLESDQPPPPPPPGEAPGQVTNAIERKLIKNGSLSFETDDLNATHQQILQAVKDNNGYTSDDQVNQSGDRINHTLEIRVPAGRFDSLVAAITKGVRHFDFKQITVNDVTEEFIDISARVKAKKEMETRYLALLKQAKTVSNMLEIERELGNIRAEIESIEGRLHYLNDQVAWSTLSVTYYEKIHGQNAFGKLFKAGIRNGWDYLVWFVIGLVNLWPFLLLTGIGVWLFRRWRKKV